MNPTVSITYVLVCLIHAPQPASIGERGIRLDGTWEVASVSWGGKMGACQKGTQTYSFSGETFSYIVTGKGEGKCEGKFRVDKDRSPMQLDLIFTINGVVETQRCIFVIDGDELKIAHSVIYDDSPSAEEETRRMREDFSNRPKSFAPKKDEPTMILTLKRKK